MEVLDLGRLRKARNATISGETLPYQCRIMSYLLIQLDGSIRVYVRTGTYLEVRKNRPTLAILEESSHGGLE